jgi:histidinol-phosphate aminotransferase
MSAIDQKRSNVRSIVAAMTAYTLELRDSEVKLNQNESPYDLPADLKDEVLERVRQRGWNLYPDFESIGLRTALARAYGLAPENILVGNGSNELLAAAIGAYVGPGTPVIFPRPTFTLYEKLVTVAGGIPVPIEFEPDSGVLPLDDMLRAIAAVESPVVILCSPNNPTGGVLPEGGLQQLLDTGASVLFDRAYGEFAEDVTIATERARALIPPLPPGEGGSARSAEPGEGHATAQDRRARRPAGAGGTPALHDRLVTFSTFSKAWGLAGLRIGWLASTEEIAREIRKVKLPYSLNMISESIAITALEHREVRDSNVARTIEERERVMRELRSVPQIKPFPSWANFIAFRTFRYSKEVFDELCARGILVRNVSSYPRMKNCLRVSIGTPEENNRFLAALREIV